MMDLQLKNKVIFLAGGSEGIGFGIAQALAQEGAQLYLGSRSLNKLEEAANKLSAFSPKVATGPLDLANLSSIEQWIEKGIKQFGQIDGLLINSGGPTPGRFEDLDEGAWQQSFELLLMGAMRLIRTSLPYLKQRPGSSILAITSSSVKEPIDELLLSNVLRSGVTSLLKSLSRDFARYQIRVNNLIPGRIATQRIEELNELVAKRSQKSLEQVTAESVNEVPLKRYGKTEEIGKAGAFLLSGAASYITGETLVVDGGLIKTVW